MTAPDRGQIGGVTIREMAGQLGRSPCKVLNYQTPLEVFTALC
jgi:IS30 family transposase